MIKWILGLLDWRAAQRAAQRRQAGWDYAAGQLLAGASIQDMAVQSHNPFGMSEFEFGMQDAIDTWETRHAK